MKLSIREIILIIIIICLFVGWTSAVITQNKAVSHVKGLYNHLVEQCNAIIDVQDKKDFCIILPDGKQQCGQNNLNAFYPFG